MLLDICKNCNKICRDDISFLDMEEGDCLFCINNYSFGEVKSDGDIIYLDWTNLGKEKYDSVVNFLKNHDFKSLGIPYEVSYYDSNNNVIEFKVSWKISLKSYRNIYCSWIYKTDEFIINYLQKDYFKYKRSLKLKSL